MKNKTKIFWAVFIVICLLTAIGGGIIYAVPTGIIPVLEFDRASYDPGDTACMSLKLTNVQAGDKTNSVTFIVDYDSSAFELATGNALNDIVNGYITFTTRSDINNGTSRSINVMYTNMAVDTPLQNGEMVFSVNFKVKSDVTPGSRTFTLRSVNMLDSVSYVYDINGGEPLTADVLINDSVPIPTSTPTPDPTPTPTPTTPPTPTPTPIVEKAGDCNNDGKINIIDLVILSLSYGSTSANLNGKWDERADFNNDNVVNALDFNILKQNYDR